MPPAPHDAARTPVVIPSGTASLNGDLMVPPNSHGLVLFAHGSGSSRLSRRNRGVAGVLHDSGFATLLMDLLTAEEEAADSTTRAHRFDIPLLARRLADATRWVRARSDLHVLPAGYFGASTGAAAALVAAAELPSDIAAVVCRGGRPDLAGAHLPSVEAPTLLIVGERDRDVIALNLAAQRELRAVSELSVVPGASHLFEEPGALQRVADLALRWFERFLTAPASSSA